MTPSQEIAAIFSPLKLTLEGAIADAAIETLQARAAIDDAWQNQMDCTERRNECC